MTTLSIFDAASEAGERIGLIDGGNTYSFASLAEMTAQTTVSHRVAAEPTIDTVIAIYSALAAGRRITLIHPRLTSVEREQLPAPAQGEGAGIIVYTSGSCAAPKPVLLTPDMLVASAAANAANLGWRDSDRWLCPLPLAHVGGLSVITRCLIARRCAALGGVDDLAGITLASVVPAQLSRMIERDPPRSLRAVLVGGAFAAPALLARARERGFPVLATYGMTEACSQIATEREPGDGLVPLNGMELRFVDGRISVRGPAVAAAFDGHDWLETGDLGSLDDRGRLVVHGRADDLIVTGGENVHPLEVESALLALPAVEDACVFGTPDEQWGEIVTAAVVASAPPDELRRQLEDKLARFKLPRRFEIADALPRTASGKVDRAAVRRRYG